MHRRDELDSIIQKLFEQNARGIVPDERYVTMSTAYEDEQAEIKKRVAELQAELNEVDNQVGNAESFLKVIHRYTDVQTLDRGILKDDIYYLIVEFNNMKSWDRGIIVPGNIFIKSCGIEG